MRVLGLGAVVVREDMPQWASHWCSNQGATLAGVSDKVVELSLVSHQSPSQSPSVSLAALREFADNAAGLVAASGSHTSFCCLNDRIASVTSKEVRRPVSTR